VTCLPDEPMPTMPAMLPFPRIPAALMLWVFLVAASTAQAADAPLVFPIRDGDLHGLIDRDGKLILPAEFSQPLQLSDGLIMASKGSRTAFFDASGRMVIGPQEQTRGPFSEGLAPAVVADAAGKPVLGYVDRRLKPVIQGAFRDVGPFSDGMAEVAVADEWGVIKRGYIDRTGKLVVPAKYEKTFPFSGGLGRVGLSREPTRVVDKGGRDVTPEGIDFIGIQAEGMIRVWSGRKEGFIDTSGRLVIAPRFEQAAEFSEGYARIWQTTAAGGRFGYIDKTGNVVIAPRFTTAEAFSDGLALVKEGGPDDRTVFIDRAGKVVLRHEFDRVYSFTSGRAVFRSGNRYGYIDKSGKIAIPATWSFARPFTGPLAAVVDGPQSAYIDLSGRVVWRSQRP
jgi:hypothetical protein